MPVDLQEKVIAEAHPNGGMSWFDIRREWIKIPDAQKRCMLTSAAIRLRDAWKSKIDLAQLPLPLLVWKNNGFIFPPQFVRPQPRRMTNYQLTTTLARWYLDHRNMLTPSDGFFFLKHFLGHELMDRHIFHQTAIEISEQVDALAVEEARQYYENALFETRGRAQRVRGCWMPLPALTAPALRCALESIEETQRDFIKNNPSIRVFEAHLLGEHVLVKRYDLRSWRDRFKYSIRPSRARRAWAAAQTLKQLNMATPEPLGILEIMEKNVPVRSYIVTRFMSDTTSAYRWLKTNYRHQSTEWKRDFQKDLLDALLNLYRNGIYHGDTKMPNILIHAPEDRKKRIFYWIDLECVSAGVRPTRYQILRNIVQLNGSVRHWVPEEDRYVFLKGLVRAYPWLDRGWLIAWIRRWTHRRLLKEVRLHCGP